MKTSGLIVYLSLFKNKKKKQNTGKSFCTEYKLAHSYDVYKKINFGIVKQGSIVTH